MMTADVENSASHDSSLECIRYQIDGRDAITSVSDSWAPFARANGAAALAEGALGRSLWEFVSEVTTEHLYRNLVTRVRAGHTVTFPYRCDAPALRRFMQMTMTPGPHEVVAFESVTLRTESRPPVNFVTQPDLRTDRLLRMCSWCKRVDVNGDWEEIERAVERLGLFGGRQVSEVTHSICPDCIERMTGDAAG